MTSKPHEKPIDKNMMSIKQWHDTYGTAKKSRVGMITQFEKVSYILTC